MAQLVFEISWISLLGLSVIFAVLVARRWVSERSEAKRRAQFKQASSSYLAQLSGRDIDDARGALPMDIRLQAVSHLMQLMRGAERDRLLAIADEEGLFGTALATARSRVARRRAEAIRTLEQFGSSNCIEALLSIMANDPSAPVRLEAATALARLDHLPPPRDTISQLSLRDVTPSRLHRALFRALAVNHSEEFRAMLEETMPAPLRVLIVESLGFSGDFANVDVLEAAATYDDPEVRGAALRAARALGDPRTGRWVMACLTDPAEQVRIQAIRAAADLGLRKGIPELRALLSDSSIWVRVRANDALAVLDPSPVAVAGR